MIFKHRTKRVGALEKGLRLPGLKCEKKKKKKVKTKYRNAYSRAERKKVAVI